MGYWLNVTRRAIKEARESVRLATPMNIVTGLFVPIVSGIGVYFITGSFGWSSIVAVCLIITIALMVFALKMVILPAKIDAERMREITALTSSSRQAKQTERQEHMSRVAKLVIKSYKFLSDGIPLAIMAGTELPPADWINSELLKRGETFTVTTDRELFWMHDHAPADDVP